MVRSHQLWNIKCCYRKLLVIHIYSIFAKLHTIRIILHFELFLISFETVYVQLSVRKLKKNNLIKIKIYEYNIKIQERSWNEEGISKRILKIIIIISCLDTEFAQDMSRHHPIPKTKAPHTSYHPRNRLTIPRIHWLLCRFYGSHLSFVIFSVVYLWIII